MLVQATPHGKPLMVTKGAPEVVLARCSRTRRRRPASARRHCSPRAPVWWPWPHARPERRTTRSAPTDEQGLTFVGLPDFRRPPKGRRGCVASRQLQRLGVDVKIITGDNGLVAAKVCSDIGFAIARLCSAAPRSSRSTTTQLEAAIPATTVFARISPDQKSRIIKVDPPQREGRGVPRATA